MLSFSGPSAEAMLAALAAKITGAGKLNIYGGTVPLIDASIDAQANPKLASLTLSNPAAAAPVNSTLTFSAITDETAADATGTATFFRIGSSTNDTVLQGTVTTAGGGGDLEMNTITFTQGLPVRIVSATVVMP